MPKHRQNKYHETLKNSKYRQRILNVEQSSFCPLNFGWTGGAAPTATQTLQRLTEKLCEKKDKELLYFNLETLFLINSNHRKLISSF